LQNQDDNTDEKKKSFPFAAVFGTSGAVVFVGIAAFFTRKKMMTNESEGSIWSSKWTRWGKWGK
jgi:hypothetical protein